MLLRGCVHPYPIDLISQSAIPNLSLYLICMKTLLHSARHHHLRPFPSLSSPFSRPMTEIPIDGLSSRA